VTAQTDDNEQAIRRRQAGMQAGMEDQMSGPQRGWKERRAFKRASGDGKHLTGECRRIMKRKAYLIPEAARAELDEKIKAVETASAGTDLDALREALSALDEKMEKHLAFARKSTVREYAESIGVAVAIAFFLRAFVVEAFQIPSGSMIPTLEVGDHIFVSKFSYGISLPFTDKRLVSFGMPSRGDVIVFKFPNDHSVDYIKRVVGLPGDRVEVRHNQIFINGEPVPREPEGEQRCSDTGFGAECDLWTEYLDGEAHKTMFAQGSGSNFAPKTIPAGEVFVMGDNRDNSNDSRVWGTVPMPLIRGRALIVWWSRAPTYADGGLESVVAWFRAIRWGRFFSSVE
jgi:signal peptidase I